MRFVAGIALGLGLGFVAGYGATRRAEAPPRAANAARTPLGPSIPSVSAAAPEAPRDPAAGTGAGTLIVRHPGTGVVALDNVVIVEGGEVISREPRTLPEIRRALAAARAASDWAAYYEALTELGTAHTREAEALLVEVMGDESLRLEGYRTGKSFVRWLGESDVPGILEAARRRVEIEIEDDPDDSRWRAVGWLALVALRGGEADLRWLEALGGGNRNTEMDVDRALAEGARNPLAAARLSERMSDPEAFRWSSHVDAFADANPDAALDAATRALPAATDHLDEVLGLIAAATTPPSVERTRAALLALRDPAARQKALGAIEKMRRRGIDVSGFDDLVDGPRLLLERSASATLDREQARAVRSAIDAIGESQVAWGDAATAAVRAFASHADPGIAESARKALGQFGTGPPRGEAWAPERRAPGR